MASSLSGMLHILKLVEQPFNLNFSPSRSELVTVGLFPTSGNGFGSYLLNFLSFSSS